MEKNNVRIEQNINGIWVELITVEKEDHAPIDSVIEQVTELLYKSNNGYLISENKLYGVVFNQSNGPMRVTAV